MSLDLEYSTRRIPSLVQLCQRVASTHVDSISGFGDTLRYELIRPILESCSAESLLRLEGTSPHIQQETPEIWKELCIRSYPLAAERYRNGQVEEPESWRDHYFVLREAEAKRIEEVGSRIKTQRLEAEERKKEREVKLTDRVPPMKRARSGWSTNPQPKTLFQKTRSEASRIQKNMYSAPLIPPMFQGKNYRVLPANSATKILPESPPVVHQVTVRKVIHRRPSDATASSSSSAPHAKSNVMSASASMSMRIVPDKPHSASIPSISSLVGTLKSTSSSIERSSPAQEISTNLISSKSSPMNHDLGASRSLGKKDPMAALFMPKHRAHSQRPKRSS